VARARVAREGPSASREGAVREGADRAGETLGSRRFKLGEGAGKREHLATGPCNGSIIPEVQRSEGRCLEQIGTSGRLDRTRQKFFLEKLPSGWEGIVGLGSRPTKERPEGRPHRSITVLYIP
jgi:hypothetical protein